MTRAIFRSFTLAGLFLCGGLFGSAHARDTVLMLPMYDVLSQAQTQQSLNPRITLHFGANLPSFAEGEMRQAGQPLGEVRNYDYARPMVNNPFGGSTMRSDQEVCREAFALAMKGLVHRASRYSGANALVQIVSSYRGNDSPYHDLYECHAGNTSAVVELKGQVYRLPASTVQKLQSQPHLPARPEAPRQPIYLESMGR